MIRAKLINEFHKTGEPLGSIGVGIVAEVDRLAKMWKYDKWRTDDWSLMYLFDNLCRNFVTYERQVFKNCIMYVLSNKDTFKRLDSMNIYKTSEYYTTEEDYWARIFNGLLKSGFDEKYLKWALSKIPEDRIVNIITEIRNVILQYLFKKFMNTNTEGLLEFHKTGNPLGSLNLGLEAELQEYAKNWRDLNLNKADFSFYDFFYTICRVSQREYSMDDPDKFQRLVTYMLSSKKYMSMLNQYNSPENIYKGWKSIYWYDIAAYLIKINIDSKYIKWALEMAAESGEKLEDISSDERSTLLSYLVNRYLDK